MVVDPVDFLGVFMGDEGSHGGSCVGSKDNSIFAYNTNCSCQFRTPIFLVTLGFPTCRVIQLFSCYIVAFRETERFGAEPVSDGLKTFSAMIERSNPRVDDLSFIGPQTVLNAVCQ